VKEKDRWYQKQLTQKELKIFIADIKVSDIIHQNNECLEICKDIGGIITFVMEIRKHYGGWLTLVTCYRLK